MLELVLRRVGDVPSAALERAKRALLRELEFLNVYIDYKRLEPSLDAYDWERRQYVASKLLKELGKVDDTLTVYLIEADAYEDNLNFVFGLAMPWEGIAGVFLRRLRNEFYGWSPDEEKFMQRVEKEVLHEVGHLLGLEHCPNPKCVMSFSNSIYDVDFKEARFCNLCKLKIYRRFSA